ncbi:hypothetical protein BD413DRAFT_670235 [Trametes elegans]|nr:hypothetical protein BD413DRAFT_670235 [Trametes elegans]
MLFNQLIMDARSLKDDKLVAIKKCHSQNHCVPIHGILPDPFDLQRTFMIMPYLRPCQNPEFSTIGDIIDFVNQTLEGLVFMHKHHVAHRDTAVENIMVNAASPYPEGHHPVRYDYTPDGLYEVAPLPRAVRAMTYHDIAVVLSLRFPPGATPSVIGRVGRDKEAPELSSTVTYNPCKVHVFALGNLFYQEFEQKYNNMKFLVPLIEKMRRTSPASRPTAPELLAHWGEIRADLSESLYRWRLGPKSEPAIERMLNDTFAAAREGIYYLKKFAI